MHLFKVAAGFALAVSLAAVAPAQAEPGSNPGHGNSGNAGNGGAGGGNSGGVVVVTPIATCALSDISLEASACSGFFAGNLLSDSPSDLAAQDTALEALGLAWDGSIFEPQLNLSTSSVNFASALNGLTYVGIHFGAGTNSPSPHTSGGVTGFYRFDAGANLDAFTLAFGSASAARLYVTQAAPPTAPNPPLGLPIDPPSSLGALTDGPLGAIPEPATWLMMILGFGAIGSVMRARRRVTVA